MTQATYKTHFKNTLRKGERQILMMRYCDKLEPAEIGIVLDLKASVVEDVLRRLKTRARSYRCDERTNPGDA